MRSIITILILIASSVCQFEPSGIYFRLNQKAVDYISELACDAFPSLLNNLNPPDVKTDMAKLSDIVITKVERPSISAKFNENRGISYNINLPALMVDLHMDVKILFFSYEGNLQASLKNLTIVSELEFEYNETTTVSAPICDVTHSELYLIFPPDSMLASLNNEIRDKILSTIQETVCTTTVNALTFFLSQKPIQPESPLYSKPEASDPNDFNAIELGASLCEVESVIEEVEEINPPADIDTNTTNDHFWGVDLSVNHPPTFSNNDMIIGLDGGIMYNGWKAESAPQPQILNKTLLDKKMIGIMLSEYIPNTLFHHIYMNDLGSFKQRYGPSRLPKLLRKLTSAICSKCFVEVTANLTEQPRIEISRHLGARIELSGNVSVMFQGREKMYDMLYANTKLHVTLKPTVRHSRVFGDVSLTNVDVNVFDIGLGGPLAVPIEKLFSFVVPRVLWPQVKKRLRFAMNRRGVKLPIMCGLELEHTELDFVDHAVLLNTDFTFDINLFIEKFKNYLKYKRLTNPNIPQYYNV